MRSFKDAEDREWRVRITAADAENVLEQAAIDIADIDKIGDIFRSHRTLISVLVPILAGQIAERNLTPDQFREGFDREVIDNAAAVLFEEIIFFCLARPLAEKYLTAHQELVKAIRQQQGTMIEEAGTAAKKSLEKKLTAGDQPPSSSAGDSAASSESTPGP